MGIIISSFIGCGKKYLTDSVGEKLKVLDATGFREDSVVDEVMGAVDKYDIVFISSDKDIREKFNERKIDYDLFYPSESRRGEFIENMVRKRVKPDVIKDMNNEFFNRIKEFDDSDAENCYKHKLSENGAYIGNYGPIVRYVESIIGKGNKADEQG